MWNEGLPVHPGEEVDIIDDLDEIFHSLRRNLLELIPPEFEWAIEQGMSDTRFEILERPDYGLEE